MLMLYTPAGVENYFLEVAHANPAADPSRHPCDHLDIRSAGARHGITFLPMGIELPFDPPSVT
jgi:hypothetical protein